MADLDFSKLDSMSPEEERRFFSAFTRALASDKGEAAKSHLAAGRPIYYGDERYRGSVVKEYPDGRRELVKFENDAEVVVRTLS